MLERFDHVNGMREELNKSTENTGEKNNWENKCQKNRDDLEWRIPVEMSFLRGKRRDGYRDSGERKGEGIQGGQVVGFIILMEAGV